jgi:hypothetical protein
MRDPGDAMRAVMGRKDRMIRTGMIVAVSVFLLSGPVFSWDGDRMGSRDSSGFVPAPRLVYPNSDEVELKKNASLRFEWSPFEGDRFGRRYYDLRLYRGYQPVESALVLAEQVDAGVYTFEVQSEAFEDQEVYTWTLRQVYDGLRKSDRQQQSFKIVRK